MINKTLSAGTSAVVLTAVLALVPFAAFADFGYGGTTSTHFSGGSSGSIIHTPSTSGQVLGASTYNFTHSLSIGSRGEDVTQLQTILIADGYLSISSPTGYFGPLTKAAVKKYQADRGIPATGFVGPLTLAALNAGTTPTAAQEQASMSH